MCLRLTRGQKIITSLICALVLISTSLPTFADNITDVEGQTLDLQTQLDGIDQELIELSEEIFETEILIEQTNGAISRTEYSLTEAKTERNEQQDLMAKRIRFVYEGGHYSFVELLFSAESISEFLNKAEFIQAMSNYDREMLLVFQEALDTIELHQEDLIFQQDALVEIKNDLEQKQVELEILAEETATDLDYLLAILDQLRIEESIRLQAEADAAAAAMAAAAAAETPADTPPPTPAEGGNGGEAPPPPPPASPIELASDEVIVFAALLEAEAFQNYQYLLAVATVILNRVADPRFPNCVHGVIHQRGQFGPVTNGSLNRILSRGPTALSIQVATDALNGARHGQLTQAHVFFNHAGASSQPGINIGGNIFWTFWPAW